MAKAAQKTKGDSKRAVAIALMTQYKDKDMDFVCDKIAAKNDVTGPNARSYYRWIVAQGLAPGKVPARGAAAPKVKATVTPAKKTAAAPAKGAKSGAKKATAKSAGQTRRKAGSAKRTAKASSPKGGD